jgi:uncharacterized protein DUF4272
MFLLGKKEKARPSAGEVMARVIILKYLFVKALATPSLEFLDECKHKWTTDEWIKFLEDEQSQHAQMVDRLHQNGLWKFMEQNECDFMGASSTRVKQQEIVDASWSIESIVCLLWALGHVSELLPYDQQADPELTNKLPLGAAQVLMDNSVLLPRMLVDKQLDLAELWHWRARTRQLLESGYKFTFPANMTIEKVIRAASAKAADDGLIPSPIADDFPAFGKAYRDLAHAEYMQATSIAAERHRALNWLCGFAPENRWAETPTNT